MNKHLKQFKDIIEKHQKWEDEKDIINANPDYSTEEKIIRIYLCNPLRLSKDYAEFEITDGLLSLLILSLLPKLLEVRGRAEGDQFHGSEFGIIYINELRALADQAESIMGVRH